MTYFQAIAIKQDLIVKLQYSGVFHKSAAEAMKETAEKYTNKQFAEAYDAIEQHMKDELQTTRELFGLAIAAKGM